MPSASSLNLIVDITNPGKVGLLQSFQNRLPASIPELIRNDVETVALRFIQPSATTSRPWDDVDYTSALTIMALGDLDAVPSSGTNTFQSGIKTVGNTNSTTTVAITGTTTGIVNGMKVAGSGIVLGTTATISGTTVTLSIAATSSVASNNLYFYNETAGIATGATAATVSTAVNALACVIVAGGVAVTNPEPGVYLFTLTVPGITPIYFSGNPAGLNPVSSLIVSEVVIGMVGISSEQLMEIFVNPYALNSTWTDFPAASATIISIATGATESPTGNNTSGQNTITSISSSTGLVVGMQVTGPGVPVNTVLLKISGGTATLSNVTTAGSSGGTYIFTTPSVQQITLTSGAYDGSFSIATPLITTQAIPATLTGTSATAVQNALNALGAAYAVSGSAGGPFTVTDPTGNNTPFTVNISNLIVPIGLNGTLTLSTYAMLQRFIAANAPTINLDLEIQVTPSGGGQSTPLQISVVVSKNVINLSNLVPSPQYIYLTQAAGDNRYTRQSNNGTDFSNLLTTLSNLWKAATTTAGAFLYMAAASTLTVLAPNSTATLKFLSMTSSVPSWQVISLPGWIIKTSAYTASAGDRIQADTSGGAVTITLPATAALGDPIQIEDASLSWGTNNLTIARNGLKINNGTSNYTASVTGNKLSIVYISSGYGWSIK